MVTHQIGHHLRDIVGHQRPFRLGVGEPAETGVDRPGQDVSHTDPVVANFLHQRLAERVERRLRRAVRRAIGKWILSRKTADVHDPPAAALAHLRQDRATTVEHAGQIRIEDGVPRLERHVGCRLERADAGVVDQNIDTAELVDSGRNKVLHVRVVAHVSPHREHALAQPLPGFMERPVAGPRYCHVCAAARQLARNRKPDPARPTCHEGDLSIERRHGY